MLWNGDMKCMFVSIRIYKGAFTDIRLFAIPEVVFLPVPNPVV